MLGLYLLFHGSESSMPLLSHFSDNCRCHLPRLQGIPLRLQGLLIRLLHALLALCPHALCICSSRRGL